MKFFDWLKSKVVDKKELEGLVANPQDRTIEPWIWPHPRKEKHLDKAFMMLEIAGVKYHVYFNHKRYDGEHRFSYDQNYEYWGFFPLKNSSFSNAYRRANPRAETRCFLIPDDDNDKNVYLGMTSCSWSDNFSRMKGRQWSIINAIEQMGLNPWREKGKANALGFSVMFSVYKGCSAKFSKILIIDNPKELINKWPKSSGFILPTVNANVEDKSKMPETPKV